MFLLLFVQLVGTQARSFQFSCRKGKKWTCMIHTSRRAQLKILQLRVCFQWIVLFFWCFQFRTTSKGWSMIQSNLGLGLGMYLQCYDVLFRYFIFIPWFYLSYHLQSLQLFCKYIYWHESEFQWNSFGSKHGAQQKGQTITRVFSGSGKSKISIL